MSEIIETYQEEQERLGKISLPDMVYATVVSQDDNGLQLLFDGEDDASTKRYPYNLSGSYGEGQRVLSAKVNGKYVVLFPVGLHGGSIQLSSLSIQSPPNKTEYLDGDPFDPTGMKVRAHYSNGAAMPVSGYSYSPQALTLATEEVTVQYTTGDITKTAEQPVSVVHRLVSLVIAVPPTKTSYNEGDFFNPAGMVVKAVYSDGAEAIVTEYGFSPAALNVPGEQTITVDYTERSVTKTASISVSVAERAVGFLITERHEAITFGGVRIRITS